jgi:hypothetical protein
MIDLLPTPAEVKALNQEQLGYYILEYLNGEEAELSHQYGPYKTHESNFLRAINECYRDDDVSDAFSGAWRWVIQQGYIAVVPGTVDVGWYRLTSKGREIKKHDQAPTSGVIRDVSPGVAPDFTPVAADPRLAAHLQVLWQEAAASYKAEAFLATVIMLGSLLEGALLGKAQANRAAAIGATKAPMDKTGKVLDLEKWRLVQLIEVASELHWIKKDRGDYSTTLRDYRNLVHPWKAASTGYSVDRGTANVSWQVVKETLRDLGIAL